MTFTQFQVHSSYSLLNSPQTLPGIIQAAKTRGYSRVALTDTNVVSGLVDFYTQAKQADIMPILGMTMQLADETFLLIAETTAGYHQLLRLSSQVMLHPDATFDDLDNFTGLAVITTAKSTVVDLIEQGQAQQAQAAFERFNTKSPASVFIGVTPAMVQHDIVAFARLHNYPLLALGDVWYQDPTDAFTQQVLQAIDAGTQLNFRDPTLFDAGERWLMPETQMTQLFEAADLTDALTNMASLAKRCDVTIDFKQPQLPHYQTPDGQSAPAYLAMLAQSGLTKRLGDPIPEAYQTRLAYELDVITKMGFADYFLVIWDVMNHAHEVGIITGPGRGSAAGSLVSYALAITEVDPIQYNLLFERFLNPNRANMPDIDLDIPDNRRNELINYVHDKYGANHMAQIVTFGTFGAKQALRDVARVFGLSQFQSNQWSNAIPPGLHVSLQQAYQQSQALKNLVADAQENQRLFQTALAIEGLPRHYSTHAAGIVLSDQPLTDTVALQSGGDGIEQTQFAMGNVEALGLLKMDFLGLRNLSILASTLSYVQKQTGQAINPATIPLDDPDTLALFARGDTNGVFQFESSGIKAVLRQLGPSSFEDVVAVNALYRPGPMENIDTFVARKHGQEPISYPAPALEPILAPTSGVLVYQEQVMQVASVMGGFSLGEADLLRRAMSKKKAAVLADEQKRFIDGALEKGFDRQTAETVYAYIDRFANYGFNRSHAVAYSMIAFWLAYLKVHFPAAFFTSLMNSSLSNTAKLRIYLQEARELKVRVVGPDINTSQRYFSVNQDQILFGLLSIKGVRRDFAGDILTARKNGPFKDLRDFLQRLDPKWLKTATLAPLVDAGVFDRFDSNRAQVAFNLDELIESVKLSGNDVGLFEMLQPKLTKVDAWTLSEQLDREQAALGVYLSGHPVEKFNFLKQQYPIQAIASLEADQSVTILAQIRHAKRIRTKKGQAMAFVDVQDQTGGASVTIFPSLYPVFDQLPEDAIVMIQGKTELRNDALQVIANSIQLADALMPSARLFIQTPQDFDASGQEILLKTVQQYHGTIPVITVAQGSRQGVLLARQYWVDGSDLLLTALKAQFGENAVVLRPNQVVNQ
ncbi:DNA polymerase III subunit alpha [Lacticaseibacillus saniviri]